MADRRPATTPLISDYYREQNERLLASGDCGGGGYKWIPRIRTLVDDHDVTGILDYGCGLGTLKEQYPERIPIEEYDPAIPGKAHPPTPHDLLVCTDVLEHVEPDLLGNVIDHLHSCTLALALVTIALRESNKSFPDGTNVHLLIEGADFWTERLARAFGRVVETEPLRNGELALVCYP